MSHYTANLRDIEFCLFDLLKRDEILGKSIFKDIDRDTSMGMLEEIKRLAENDLADSFVESADWVCNSIKRLAILSCLKVLRSHIAHLWITNGGALMHPSKLVEL